MILSFDETASGIRMGNLDLRNVVKSAVDEIGKRGELNAFIEVFEESALKSADEIMKKAAKGSVGKLAGMVVGIKDNICYKDHEVTASSAVLKGFRSLYSATVVERLIAEDAVIIGRLSCDEFAMGSSNENSVYGPVRNPHDLGKVPGGSSGGASAAVAAGLCHVALGSDTGGSIRQPASFTGTFGMKPTYGRVSRHGLIAYSSSFDQIGPIASNLDDLARVLEVICGKDDYDSTMLDVEPEKFFETVPDTEAKKFAFYNSYVEHKGLDPEIKTRFFEITEFLKNQGHEVVEKEFKYLDQLVPAYYVLTTAEASSNLARYDGIHYGYRSEGATDLLTTYTKSRSEGFGKEVKRRIMLGTYVLSEGYYDAYYTKGQKVRRIIKSESDELFREVDFVISPTCPHTAFGIGDQTDDPIKMYLEDIFTVQAPLAGLPAISLPLGKHSNGLPFGIQLTAPAFREADLLSISRYLINKL